MTPRRLARLLDAVAARSRLEQARLATLARARRALIEEAEALDAEARIPIRQEDVETGADLRFYAGRQNALERAAAARTADAAEMAPLEDAQRGALRKSYSEETAWRKIAALAALKRRRALAGFDEERREALNLSERRRKEAEE